jgi:hypothetical protein
MMTIYSFLTVALTLRLAGFAASTLWYDEYVSLSRASMPLAEWTRDTTDFIGVNLWDLILRAFTWGPHWVLRIPALVCAMVSLWLAWRVMVELKFDERQMTISALMMACLPGLTWMSQDARYYASLAALYMGAMLAALRGEWKWLAGMAAASFLIHPTGPAYTVPAVGIGLLSHKLTWKQSAYVLLISGAVIAVHWITKPINADAFWTNDLTFAWFVYSLGQSITVDVLGHAGTIVFAVIAALLLAVCIYFGGLTWVIWSAPVAVIVVVSLAYANVITYRTLQPAAMGFALALGFVLGRVRFGWIPAAVMLAALLLYWDPSTRGGDLAAIAERIRYEWKAGDCIEYSEFGKPLRLLLEELPECASTTLSANDKADGRRWTVDGGQGIVDGGLLVVSSDIAWQIAPVSVYLYDKP